MRNILQGFTMWIDSLDYGIDTEEVDLPFPVPMKQDYRGGGMDLAVSVSMAAINALSVSVKMSGLNSTIMSKMALAPGIITRVTFRAGVLREQSGEIATHICVVEGQIEGNQRDKWSRGEKAGFDFEINGIRYLRYEADQFIIHELQAWPPKRVINGVDQLAGLNQALGY